MSISCAVLTKSPASLRHDNNHQMEGDIISLSRNIDVVPTRQGLRSIKVRRFGIAQDQLHVATE